MRWHLRWGRAPVDPAPLEQAEQRLAEAQQMATEAQPVIRRVEKVRRRNHLSESVDAALHVWGARQ
jgi:hypothetical protein